MIWCWYVLTPAGLAGPYRTRQDAEDAARPYGWKVLHKDE